MFDGRSDRLTSSLGVVFIIYFHVYRNGRRRFHQRSPPPRKLLVRVAVVEPLNVTTRPLVCLGKESNTSTPSLKCNSRRKTRPRKVAAKSPRRSRRLCHSLEPNWSPPQSSPRPATAAFALVVFRPPAQAGRRCRSRSRPPGLYCFFSLLCSWAAWRTSTAGAVSDIAPSRSWPTTVSPRKPKPYSAHPPPTPTYTHVHRLVRGWAI
jgi:hypothetical protein